jgi:hypothetical protein
MLNVYRRRQVRPGRRCPMFSSRGCAGLDIQLLEFIADVGHCGDHLGGVDQATKLDVRGSKCCAATIGGKDPPTRHEVRERDGVIRLEHPRASESTETSIGSGINVPDHDTVVGSVADNDRQLHRHHRIPLTGWPDHERIGVARPIREVARGCHRVARGPVVTGDRHELHQTRRKNNPHPEPRNPASPDRVGQPFTAEHRPIIETPNPKLLRPADQMHERSRLA